MHKFSTSTRSLWLLLSLSIITPISIADTEVKQITKNEPKTEIIEEVLVTGQQQTPAFEMDTETEEFFGIAGAANDPLQAIYSLPGVTFSSNSGSEPVIRGSSPQDNAYFIDLIPVSYIFHLFGNSVFDKHLIHSFDLYPAAFSNEYGNATGGIIDVKLREPKNQGFTTTIHNSILSAGIMVETGIGDNQSLYAAYRRSMMDKILDKDSISDDENGFTVNKLPIWSDYQFKYLWNINDNNSLSLIAAGASDIVAATFSEGNEEVEKDPDFAGPAEIDMGFDSQGIVWNWSQDNSNLTTILSHINESQEFTYGKGQSLLVDTERYLSRIKYQQNFSEDHLLTLGVIGQRIIYYFDLNAKIVACSSLDPDCPTVDAVYTVYKDTLKVTAYELYFEDKWYLNDSHALSIGVHYGNDDHIKAGRLEPRARWDYNITDNLSTYISAGQYSQLPELGEMIDVIGNPNLDSIKADHYVWGFNQRLGDSWSWNTDVYFKNLSDIVVSNDNSPEKYQNGAEGKAYGIEFLVKKELTDRWYGWTALSFAKTDRTLLETNETILFEYDKPVLFNLVLNRKLGESWMLGIKWNYQSGGRYTPITRLATSSSDPNVKVPIYGDLNSETLPDYHRLDFRAEYTSIQNWGYWKFYVDVLNVYNRENIEGYDYSPGGTDLIKPPKGFGKDIPVEADKGNGLFPSIGFEVQF